MKKLSFFAVAFTAMVFAACGGNKSNQTAEATDSIKSFEQQQVEASIKMHVDSLAEEIGKLKMVPFLQSDGNGGLKLTKEELQVKPNYLLDPAVAEEATTLADKYRIMSALDIDKRCAKLYEAINENGRINYFWQLASASLIEQLYIANQNADKYLSTFTDEAAANTTFRIVLILDALNRLSQYDPDIKPTADALAPLEVLNATSVAELKAQLAEAKDKIEAARKTLVK